MHPYAACSLWLMTLFARYASFSKHAHYDNDIVRLVMHPSPAFSLWEWHCLLVMHPSTSMLTSDNETLFTSYTSFRCMLTMIMTFFAWLCILQLHAYYDNDIICWLCILSLHAHNDNDIVCMVCILTAPCSIWLRHCLLVMHPCRCMLTMIIDIVC